jgi:hypothetical protein
MSNRSCVLTQSRHLSVSEARQACYEAFDLTHVLQAHACLQTLLSRARRPDEDDADVCDGLASLVRLVTESLNRREDDAMTAIATLFQVIEREAGG